MVDATVVNNTEAHRFEIVTDGATAMLTYRVAGHHITMIHTEVPHALEGRGYAAALARAALDFARASHLRVVPHCPFVRAYIERHPEYADLLAPNA